MDYLQDTITPEDKAFRRLVKAYFKEAFYTNHIENETMREQLLKLQEVKKNYWKGLPFVKNLTKDQKKGLNYRWYIFLKKDLEREGMNIARQNALHHLEYIKRNYSERTYYRHKKKIRALGIEIKKNRFAPEGIKPSTSTPL